MIQTATGQRRWKPVLYSLLWGGVATAVYWASAGGFLFSSMGLNLLHTVDVKSMDALTQQPRVVNPNIFVIGIDDVSLRELGAWNSWDRGLMAQLVRTLNADPTARPAVIGIDVSYFSETDPQYDEALAAAAAEGGNVVTAAEAVYTDALYHDAQGNPHVQRMSVSGIDYPYPALRRASAQGIINTATESDGVIRNSIHRAEYQEETIYSFGYTIYREYARTQGLPEELQPPLDSLNRFHIPFSGLPGDYFGGSFARVLDGSIPPQLFAGAIVLIGPYAPGMMDQYYTPIDSSRMMYGIEIHANIIDALLAQDFKRTAPLWVQALLLFVVTVVAYWLFFLIEPKLSFVILAALIGGYLLYLPWQYAAGWIVSAVYIPLVLVVLYIYRVVYRYFTEKAKRQAAVSTFKRYLEPQVVEYLLQDGAAQQRMEGEKRDIAVLFADIRGFTPMSESLETAQIVAILNEYLSLASSCIFQNKGTVDKFIGDAAMALFNAPLDLEDYTYRAVKAGLDIATGVAAMQARLLEQYGRTINVGVGIHCGEAIVGNIGADFRLDYTAIGDTVNTAARLESTAKAGQIIISEAVYARVKDRVQAISLGTVSLKGKAKPIEVYLVEKLIDITE